MKPTCQSMSLEQVLSDQCDAETESRVQEHLETCDACRHRLETLAADPQIWNDTSKHLSSTDDVAITKQLRRRLQDSSSFLIQSGAGFSAKPDVDRPTSSLPSWQALLDPPRHPEMLGQIDHFEIESKIGQGGMGIVLKGFDRELNRAVAIKVLAPHLASNGTARKRFAREAQAAAAVVHPNVVPIYSVNQNVERPYIAMQLVSGRSLQSVVEDDGPLTTRSVIRIAIQIADGLAAAHDQGLIHRDVKPANVLTERDVTRVMITDFGLARAVDDVGMTQTGWLAGTPHYMSPEQAKGEDVDPRSDLFSLGSLMYFLATGREPFRAERSYGVIQKIINEQPIAPNQLNSELPEALSQAIEKLLAKQPAERFQTAAELADYLRDLLAYLEQPNIAQPPIKLSPPRPKSLAVQPGLPQSGPRLNGWIWGVAGVLAILMFSSVGWLISKIGMPSSKTNATGANTALRRILKPGANAFPAPEFSPLEIPTYTDDALIQEIDQADAELSRLEQMFAAPIGSFQTPSDQDAADANSRFKNFNLDAPANTPLPTRATTPPSAAKPPQANPTQQWFRAPADVLPKEVTLPGLSTGTPPAAGDRRMISPRPAPNRDSFTKPAKPTDAQPSQPAQTPDNRLNKPWKQFLTLRPSLQTLTPAT